MESPGQTIKGLTEQYDKQPSTWTTDGATVVYVRTYTYLDPEQEDAHEGN